MSTIEVTCACGWTITSNDRDAVTVSTRNHDRKCRALFAPDVVAPLDPTGLRARPIPSGQVEPPTAVQPPPHGTPPADFDG